MPNPFTAPPSAKIRVGENGYVHGIDAMLHQIAGAFVKEAMPTLQRDKAMQVTIGQAAGAQIAQPVWWLAIIAAIVGGVYILRASDANKASQLPTRKSPG